MSSMVIVAPSALAPAQEPIMTDRPGFTFSPWLVPAGRFQAELGIPNVVLMRGSAAESTAWNTPLQLRCGIDSAFELRVACGMYSIVCDETTDSTIEGFNDVEVGAKVALCEGAGVRPKASLIGGIRLPVGSEEFTSQELGYNAHLAGDWDLGGGHLLRGSAGVTRTPIGSDDSLVGTFAALYGRAFDAHWISYVELTFLPGFHAAEDQSYAGVGLLYQINNDLQLDLSGDFGLDDDSADAILGFGISWRR